MLLEAPRDTGAGAGGAGSTGGKGGVLTLTAIFWSPRKPENTAPKLPLPNRAPNFTCRNSSRV